MKVKKRMIISILMLISCMTVCSFAQAQGVAVSGKISSLGPGIDLTTSLSETVNARLGIHYFTIDYSETDTGEGVQFDLGLNLLSVAALLDWFPFGNVFRISGGLLYNGNEIEACAQATDSFEIGDREYTPEEVGTLKGTINFNSIAPYIGFGLGNAMGEGKRWGFMLDIGVVFQGTPEADLSANGLLGSDPEFLAELAKEEEDLQDEVDPFTYYPVLSLGISYKF